MRLWALFFVLAATPVLALRVSESALFEDVLREDAKAAAAHGVHANKCNGQRPLPAASTGGSSLLSVSEKNTTQCETEFIDFRCSPVEMVRFRRAYGLPQIIGKAANTNNVSSGERCKKENVVWFYPAYDDNGAFTLENQNTCYRLLNWKEHSCSVQVYRVSTIQQIQATLKNYPRGSIKHLVLGGHGDGQSIEYGGPAIGQYCCNQDLCVPGTGEGRGCGDPATELMQYVKDRVQQFGTIFIDSCLNGGGDVAMPLSKWAADTVGGTGIRVYGSDVSFDEARVSRFDNFHVKIHIDEQKNAERMFTTNDKDYCPHGVSTAVDGGMNCKCNIGQCRDEFGSLCPVSYGKRSSTSFLPGCAHGVSAGGSCSCVDQCSEERDGSPTECCQVVPMSTKRHTNYFSNMRKECKCTNEATLTASESGMKCAQEGARTFGLDDSVKGCVCAVPDKDRLSQARRTGLFRSDVSGD